MAVNAAVVTSIISGAAQVGSSILDTINKVQGAEQEAQIAGYNASVARADAQRLRGEYAMNAGLLRANARYTLAEATNAMAASGNVGPSADATILNSYFNLAGDLASMKYNYDNRVVNKLNEAQNYDYIKKVAKRSKTSAIIGGLLGGTAAVTGAYDQYSKAGGKYGYKHWGLIEGK